MISSHLCENLIDYWVLKNNKQNDLIEFHEKPASHYDVSMQIYMANRKNLTFFPDGAAFRLYLLMIDLLNNNQNLTVKNHAGYCLDIGIPNDYIQAIREFKSMKALFIHD